MSTVRDFLPSLSRVVSNPVADGMNEAVVERSIFYRLGDSEVFQYANKNTVLNGQRMIDVIPRMILSDQGFLQVSLNQLDRTVVYELFEGPHYKLSCKKSLRSLIEDGSINMVYSEQFKLPTALPYIVQGAGSKARIFVNISDFVQLDQYGKYQVVQGRNYNGLLAVIFAAAVSLKIIRAGGSMSKDLQDGIVHVYAAMMERAINSLVHMDPITKEKVRYLATEFVLIQMYGTEDGQRMFLMNYKERFPKLTKMITDSLDAQFQLDSFDKVSSFVEELRRLYPSMRGLTEYLLMDKWIRLYGASTALSMDYIGYHIYTLCMVLFESPLISRMALEPVLEKNRGTEVYRRMQAMIGPQ